MTTKTVSLDLSEPLTYDCYKYDETNSFLARGASLADVPSFVRPYIITYFEGNEYTLVSLECTEDEGRIFKLPNGVRFVFDNPTCLFRRVEDS